MALFHLIKKNKGTLLRAILLSSICVIAFFSLHLQSSHLGVADSANISINYASPVRKLDPVTFGMDISGYGYPNVFVNDRREQQQLKALGIKYMRVELKYSVAGDPKSKIVCAGNGCDTRWTGDQWVDTIKSIGATPVIIVHYNAADAVNIVNHFNKDTHNYVRYWIIGNEPDLKGMDVATYSGYFNQEYDAMKAVDSTIKIGGGTTAWYDIPFLRTFLQKSGAKVDFVDFHVYAQKGDVPGDNTQLFQETAAYGDDINNLRSLIKKMVPARAAQIGIEVGEWELNWGGNTQDNVNFHAVWAASVIGHILSSGARSLFYADKENALYGSPHTFTDSYKHGVTVHTDDTNPAYHGIGMFTGEGLFRSFGDTLVNAHTKLQDVEVYASDNSKNIVLINKNSSTMETAIINFNGVFFENVDVWRKDEAILFSNPPVKVQSTYVRGNIFTYQLPPLSVTTLVLTASFQISPTSVFSPISGRQRIPLLAIFSVVALSFRGQRRSVICR
ncbi:MAG: ricin-type beta-trefoil lectin domain protein [Ktedonobacteraceae bacterium]